MDVGGTTDRPGGRRVGLAEMAAALGVHVAALEIPTGVSFRHVEVSLESSSHRPLGDVGPVRTLMECVSIWYEVEHELVLVKTARADVGREVDDQVRDVLSNLLIRPGAPDEDAAEGCVRELMLRARCAPVVDIGSGPGLDKGRPAWRGARVGSTLALATGVGERIVAVAGPEQRVRSASLSST